jgi:hypothetical protein
LRPIRPLLPSGTPRLGVRDNSKIIPQELEYDKDKHKY